MPTEEWFKDNPKVSAYISPETRLLLKKWMGDRGIKKISQALTRIIEEHLGVVQVEPEQPAVDSDRLGELEAKLADLTQRFEAMGGAIAPPIAESSLPVNQSSKIQLSILEEPQENEVVKTELNTPEIWTTKEVEQRLEITRNKLEGWKNTDKLPHTAKGYTILGWAGKQPKRPFSNLWQVQKTD